MPNFETNGNILCLYCDQEIEGMCHLYKTSPVNNIYSFAHELCMLNAIIEKEKRIIYPKKSSIAMKKLLAERKLLLKKKMKEKDKNEDSL